MHKFKKKATNTHSKHVTIIALTLQQWLHKRPSMLRYTCIACIVSTSLFHNNVIFCSPTGFCLCVSAIYLSFRFLGICILNNSYVHKPYHVPVSTHSSPEMGHPEVRWSTASRCLHNRNLQSISSSKTLFLKLTYLLTYSLYGAESFLRS